MYTRLTGRLTGSVMAATILAAASVAHAQAPAPADPRAIVTRGEAVLKRAPDQAWLHVSTEVRDPKPAEARRRSAEMTTAVITAIRGTGLAADAIQTTGYSLSPDMEWVNGSSRLKGYIVRNEMEVRIDDLDKLSAVIDAANVPKAAGLSITGPRFDLKNRAAAEHQALRMAVENALARAQAIAMGARATLAAIVRIEDLSQVGGFDPPRPQMMRSTMAAEMKDMPTPITPGEIEVRAQVQVTVGIR